MGFTHFNDEGRARMVDVGSKDISKRVAIAEGEIWLGEEILEAVKLGGLKKGDVLSVAQVAGIMGAKNTSQLIPMCHQIFLTGIDIDFVMDMDKIIILGIVKCQGKTGVEMEALTAVSVAALTIYDMVKAMGKDMVINNIRLIQKDGGKSGNYVRSE